MENPVIRDTDEWDTIEFSLRLRCRSSRVNLLQAWNITKSESVAVFNTRSKNGIVLETFIDTESLDRNNSVQDICNKGFEIDSAGLKVSFGNINLADFPLFCSAHEGDKPQKNHTGTKTVDCKLICGRSMASSILPPVIFGEKRVFEYLICDVGLGKSISVPDEIEAQRSRTSMPVEYDSFFLDRSEPKQLESSIISIPQEISHKDARENVENVLGHLSEPSYAKGVLPRSTFKCDYIIYDNSQILARYLIQFECDPCGPELYALPLCDNCQNDAAAIYCPSDSAKICSKCDVRLHSHNKVVSRHIRVDLNRVPRPNSRCKIHPSKIYHLYCSICHVPICQLCTPNHIHTNSPEEASSSFLPISTAYDALVHDLQLTSNAILARRREKMLKTLENLEILKADILNDCEHVEAKCYEKLELTLSDLHDMISHSLEQVAIEQTENKRQMSEINWSERFLDHVRCNLLPADYLRAWLCHCRLRKRFAENSHHKPQKEIFADAKLEAELCIMPQESDTHS